MEPTGWCCVGGDLCGSISRLAERVVSGRWCWELRLLVVAFGSYLTWFSMLRRYSAARLGVLSFMTPVLGVAAGIVLLGDRIDAGFGFGATMILTGIAIANMGLPRWPWKISTAATH